MNDYNFGRGPDVFATRVRMLSLHPEIWSQMPDGLRVGDWDRSLATRQIWTEVVDFLKACGLLSPKTTAIDVNVPKLVSAARALAKLQMKGATDGLEER